MKHILIVEDILETQVWLEDIASKAYAGCAVQMTSSVKQGVAAAKQQGFDLALIDLGLPDGSGLDVLRQLKQISPTTICVITTVMGDG